MAYDRTKIYKQALEASKDPDAYHILDVIAALPISPPTFYDFFPPESNELNTLKENLDKNKINTKKEIRGKLRKGEKASELIALYKLIGTDEERKALSQTYQTIDGELKNNNSVTLSEDQFNEVLSTLIPDNEE